MTRRRLRRRWAVLLGATVLGVVLMARPAAAQSAPDPASTTPPPVSPCAAGDGEGRGSSIVPDDC